MKNLYGLTDRQRFLSALLIIDRDDVVIVSYIDDGNLYRYEIQDLKENILQEFLGMGSTRPIINIDDVMSEFRMIRLTMELSKQNTNIL